MSKNAEGWIRHRGGKCPVDGNAVVQVVLRRESKKYFDPESCPAHDWNWSHDGGTEDLMYYRLHKATEQVDSSPHKCEGRSCSMPESGEHSKECLLDAALDQGWAGPREWRDRIAEIDIEVQARTVERAELVQKLASEGFALIERINELLTDAAKKHEDMSDWRNWRVGDRIEVISNGFDGRGIGEMLTVDGLDSYDNDQPVGVMGDDGTHSWPMFSDDHFSRIKFHSRPSA